MTGPDCEAVIFDLFGTLVDSFSVREHERAISEMAAILSVSRAEFACLWNSETWLQRATGVFPTVEANIEHICWALGVRAQPDLVAVAARVRIDTTRRNLAPRVDAVETLARLKTAGYKTGLISDCSAEVPVLWQETAMAPLVDAVVFSCAVGLKKPDPRIYRLACERLAVLPQRCLYVGDGSSRELTGAFQVGMRPILIRVPLGDAYDAHRVDAEAWHGSTISSLSEILAYLG